MQCRFYKSLQRGCVFVDCQCPIGGTLLNQHFNILVGHAVTDDCITCAAFAPLSDIRGSNAAPVVNYAGSNSRNNCNEFATT